MVDLVHECLQRGGGREAAEACAELISVSAARWRQFEGAYRDDISCIVLRLPCFGPLDGHAVESTTAAAGEAEAAIKPAIEGVVTQGGEERAEFTPV